MRSEYKDVSLAVEATTYDPETGIISYRKPRYRVKRGHVANLITKNGYVRVVVGGRSYMAHRVAWAHVHGSIPPNMQVDHINGERADNRLVNLRVATPAQNCQNVTRAKVGTKSGLLGASWSSASRKWTARLTANGKTTCLGSFDTAMGAHRAYIDAKVKRETGELH